MIKIGIIGSIGRVGKLLVQNIIDETNKTNIDKIDFLQLSVLHIKSPLSHNFLDIFNNQINANFQEMYKIVFNNKLPIITSDIFEVINNSDVIIDFSTANGTEKLCENILKLKEGDNIPKIVIGTTGLNNHQINLLKDVSQKTSILYSSNMSIGIALLKQLVQKTSSILKDFDIEIVEKHHNKKIDAPSGTALTLGEFAAQGRDLDLNKVRISGREGQIEKRTKDEIGIMAIRGGDIVGSHTVGFYNDGEFLELNHTATSRETFSKGAILATKWISSKKENGLFSINDCLGL